MTDRSLICPHCGALVCVEPGAEIRDRNPGMTCWYACPLHGAVEPVEADAGE